MGRDAKSFAKDARLSDRAKGLLVVCACLVLWTLVSLSTPIAPPAPEARQVRTGGADEALAPAEPQQAEAAALASATATSPSPASASGPLRIPRLIHQSWKSTEKIPSRFAPWMRSWVEMHPGWQYVYWGDDDNLAIFTQLYPKYAEVARNVGKIGLADMARYALLHRLGGLYVDADFECKQPFDELHRNSDVFLSSEPRAHAILLEGSPEPAVCNALMASVPGHPFWIQVLDSIKAGYDAGMSRGDPVSLTGPRIVKKTLEAKGPNSTDVVVFSPEYFYPEVAYWNMGNLKKKCRPDQKDPLVNEACAWLEKFPHGEYTANTYATHRWQCTWCNGDGGKEFVSLSNVMRHKNGAPMLIFRPKFEQNDVRLEYYPLDK